MIRRTGATVAARKRWIIIGIAVVVVLALVAVADRVGRSVTEGRIADGLKRSYGLSHTPQVTITGFPFLGQAVSGTYDRIEVKAAAWTHQPQNVEVDNLRITLHHASFSLGDVLSDGSTPLADSATATALLPYTSLMKHFFWGVKTIQADGDRLRIIGVLQGPNYNVDIDELAVPHIVRDIGIQLDPVSIHDDQPKDAPQLTSALLQQRLTALYPLTALPGTATLDRIQLSPTGLVITASA